MYKVKEGIKRMERMALMVQKKSKDLPSEILVQKGTNLTRNERQGNKVGNLFLPNLVLHPRRRKKRSKKQSKANRDEEQDSSIFFFIVFSFLEFCDWGRKPRNQEVPYSIEWRSIISSRCNLWSTSLTLLLYPKSCRTNHLFTWSNK